MPEIVTNSESFLGRILRETGTNLSRDDFIRAVNTVYHELEAEYYDEQHTQIWQQGKGVWNELLNGLTLEGGAGQGINMLDFGAGTGFASLQVIEKFGPERFDSVTFVEPSEEMARIGLGRLSNIGVRTVRVTKIPENDECFDIVCANSVLHHLPDPFSIVTRLGGLLKCRGSFLMAQEPNAGYHSSFVGGVNRMARRIFRVFRRHGPPIRLNQRMLAVSNELVRRGITPAVMNPAEIGLVVDYWVPRPEHSERSTERLGFGIYEITEALGQRFMVKRVFTYDFLGKPTFLLPPGLALLNSLVGSVAPMKGQQLAIRLQKT